MVDFTNCDVDVFRTYDGANGTKICIIHEQERYMLKFPPPAKNPLASYSNSCISEHLASSIYRTLDMPTQETLLGNYTTDSGKEKVVVACKDFCGIGDELVSFARIKNTCVDSEHNGFGTELSPVLEAIETQKLLDPLIIKRRFWLMFSADAFLGNFDRHNGNWGFLINQGKEAVSLAPVYDNGSCLYPQLTEEQMKMVLNDRTEIENRIYVFPNSALKINGKKINYLDFLLHSEDSVCNDAFKWVYERIDFTKIEPLISNLPVSKIAKDFYATMLHERKSLLMDVVWKNRLKSLTVF